MPKQIYKTSSPYFDTPQTSWYMLPMVPRNIPRDSTDHYILVTSEFNNRPDLMSFQIYGSSAYWWVFQVMNMDVIRDPIWDFKTDIRIYAPTAERLNRILG